MVGRVLLKELEAAHRASASPVAGHPLVLLSYFVKKVLLDAFALKLNIEVVERKAVLLLHLRAVLEVVGDEVQGLLVEMGQGDGVMTDVLGLFAAS